MMNVFSTLNPSDNLDYRPSPLDLLVYLPWACGQMQCPYVVSVIKATQTEYVSVMTTSKKGKTKPKQAVSEPLSSDFKKDDLMSQYSDEVVLKIRAIHDTSDRLVELKFENKTEIPRVVFQVLGLIIKFQIHLNTLTINRGIDMYSIHEINKFLPVCNITDLCLDGTYMREANYYVLLENYTSIKRISLARCRIIDKIVEIIAAKLVYPLPASKTLCILDLSANKITDLGAKHIANMLRSNRCLAYLNLSGNALTDVGGKAVLSCLVN